MNELFLPANGTDALAVDVLGTPGNDNAVLATLRTGERMVRVLFDCGANCLDAVRFRDLQQIDVVAFSHFHMDHVSGFDTFVRANFAREQPVRVFGPRGSHAIVQHRLQGYLWDLVAGTPGRWLVTEIAPDGLRTIELRSAEAFAIAHPLGSEPFAGTVLAEAEFTLDAAVLDHGPSDSIGYVLRQRERRNVDRDAMARAGLKPGPWLKALQDPAAGDDQRIAVAGGERTLGELRHELLVARPGDSVGYLTDFRRTAGGDAQLQQRFHGCRRLVCENNYADEDAELAQKNNHMTSSSVGELATLLAPEELLVFHLTDRYEADGWRRQLEQVRGRFARSWFPCEWRPTFAS